MIYKQFIWFIFGLLIVSSLLNVIRCKFDEQVSRVSYHTLKKVNFNFINFNFFLIDFFITIKDC